MVYDGIPPGKRPLFWSKCSGYSAYKSNYCDNYYKKLCAADESGTLAQYPNKHFQQIDKDLDRTAPEDPFFTPEIRQSLRRICRAYVWRNPTVGYCQSMNFIVFRLRKQLPEEDTFWLFCLIVESYLPPDFYIEMYGAKSYATILKRIFEQYNILPQVLHKFEKEDYPIVALSCQFFMSLFTNCLPEHASLQVLDLFFLDRKSVV